jgi:mannose-1-phosphate guanylyltransferase
MAAGYEKEEFLSIHLWISYRPDAQTAKKYFSSGHHAWNLGYFVTTPAFMEARGIAPISSGLHA